MKYQKIKDQKLRFLFKKTELKNVESKLSSRIKNKNFLFNLEKKQNTFFSSIKIVKRCLVSNKKNCINKQFSFSRIILRAKATNCLILGLKKSS